MNLRVLGCGCIGFPTDVGKAFIIKPCDGDEEFGFFERDILDENFPGRALDYESVKKLFVDVGKLVGLGYQYKELAATLKFMVERV